MAKSTRKTYTPAPERRFGTQQLGNLLPQVGGMAFKRFGFSHNALLARWAEVVGPVYARWSVPEALRLPRGGPSGQQGGVLVVRVEGPFALQFQHVAPQIVSRVNQILGHKMVEKLKIVQGDVPQPIAKVQKLPIAEPDINTLQPDIRNLLEDIPDEGLRAALTDLAAQVALDVQKRNG